jgi:acyl-ACP thioesterase
VSTRLELPVPGPDVPRTPWPLRATDVDLHGHVNNAVYWQAVEDVLRARGTDPRRPLVAELDYRDPIDLSDPLELAVSGEDRAVSLGFCVGEAVRAVARVTALDT